MMDAELQGRWDYIVIGAGSAGCVVANRLSADPAIRVLLLEAGGDDNRLKYKVPALGPLTCLGDRDADWNFATAPDPSRGGRVDRWPRGRVLGGSSSINGTVYVRGNLGDYDHWRQLGNTGWSYDDLIPFFQKVEGHREGASGTYGTEGAVTVSQTRGVHRLARVFLDAMAELGTPINPHYNGEQQTGAAITHVSQRGGWRVSASRAYLKPARSRPNLAVLTGALVHRIVMDGSRAVGVEFERAGRLARVRADGEVILSASAINSPKILMLSGIGPGDMLARHGLRVVHANNGVGANLHEHACAHVVGLVNVRTSNMDTGVARLAHAARFALFGSGAATYVSPAVAFVKTRRDLDDPDIQFHFGVYGYDFTPDGVRMLDRPAVTLQPNVNRSRSRGFLTLRSADPAAPPHIQPNMLDDPWDLQTLVEGVRYGRRVLQTRAFAPYVIAEHKPGPAVDDLALSEHVRAAASGVFHPCGTCKMGTDLAAVVDPDLKVHGVERLRVIDSSIIPQIPSGNINAISLVIGEKGAEALTRAHRGA